MAKKKRSTKLSLGEFRLMGMLWEQGPLTLSEAHQHQSGSLGYTTIQTQLNRLVDKGVAVRTKVRPMKYRAVVTPQSASDGILQLLVETVGHGSVVPIVTQLLSNAVLTADEVRELKALIITKPTPKKRPVRRSPEKKKAKRS